ncbi:hypothetical protein DNTS_017534, partial [Danionella cerebrum]
YELSEEVLPNTPRLTHFPTVSGSPASLANSMQNIDPSLPSMRSLHQRTLQQKRKQQSLTKTNKM